jgi:DNA-directed RNA polymerase specialized sigma24 family protein
VFDHRVEHRFQRRRIAADGLGELPGEGADRAAALAVEADLDRHRLVAAGTQRVEAVELSERQRRVFEAIVLNEVPPAALAAELGTNRGALYKTLFDARRKLREAV